MRIVAVLLMSYGPDLNELFRQAAVHVDEILNDMRPEELPVAATDTLRALRRRADSPSARPHDPAGDAATDGSGDRVTSRGERRRRQRPISRS